MAMYVRVKRQKTTYFIRCDPCDKVRDVKCKLHALTRHAVGDQRLILLDSHHVLADACMLCQQQVENGSILALTLKKGNGQWEDIDIANMGQYEEDSD